MGCAMRERDVPLPEDWPTESVLAKVEGVLAASGLTVAMCTTLKTRSGSTHWHLKCGAEAGTLELTWWPQRRRLWFSVHANREGPWIDGAIGRLVSCVTHVAATESQSV